MTAGTSGTGSWWPTGEPSPAPDPLDELRESLVRLLGADRRLKGRVAKSSGTLGHTHLRALLVLLREGEATAGTLARVTDLNPASVTAMIDQLERRGLLQRRRHDGDRRVCLVALTESGRHQVAAQEAVWTERLRMALADLQPAELATAARVLERLRAAMEDAADGSG